MAGFSIGSSDGVEGNMLQNDIFDILKKRNGSKITTTFNETIPDKFKENHVFDVKNFESDDVKQLEKLIQLATNIREICKRENI